MISRILAPMLALIWAATVATLQGGAADNLSQDRSRESAAALHHRAIAAIGGAERLNAIKSLILNGENQVRNQWHRPGTASGEFSFDPFEIRALLPDYVLLKEHRGSTPQPFLIAFHGKRVLTGHKGGEGIRRSLSARFLAWFLISKTPISRRLEARLDGGSTLRFTGDGETMLVDIDPATALPLRVRTSVVMQNGPNVGRRQEIAWKLEDRRQVSGLNLPHRIVVSRGDTVDTIIRLTSVTLNPALTPADFSNLK